jgi:hypothetical protein
MKLLQTAAVLGIFALASAKPTRVPSAGLLEEEEASQGGAVRRRSLKQNKGGGGGTPVDEPGIDRSGGYLNCKPFENVREDVKDFTLARDPTNECLTKNTCNTGCCRIFNYLVCDPVNEYYWLQVRRVGPTSIVLISIPPPRSITF